MTEHWKGRGIAAAAIARKAAANPKPRRDFVGDAYDAIGLDPHRRDYNVATVKEIQGMLGAVIVAQALDRLVEKIGESAAVINYKRV